MISKPLLFRPLKTQLLWQLYAATKTLGYEKQTKTQDSFRLLLVEVLHRRKVFKNGDFSHLFLYGLLRIEICSLRKRCKGHSDQFVKYGKGGFWRRQAFSLFLEKIRFKESVLVQHRSGHSR